jgi:tight adherence protein C
MITPPPAVALWVPSITIGLLTLLAGGRLAWRIPSPRRLQPHHVATGAARRRRAWLPARVVAAAGGATVALLVVLAAGVILAAAAVVTAAGLAAAVRSRRVTRRRRERDAALPLAIEMLVLAVHAGLSPTQAVLDVADRAPRPCRRAFAAARHRLERGQPLAEALGALVDELGPVAAPLAEGIAAADHFGLPLGPLLDELAVQARESRRRLAEADARALPVRLSFPLVVCTLPSFALLAIVPAVLGTISSLRGRTP